MNKTGYPEPIAGVFIMKGNKLFLFKSHKWSNEWVIPGGHIELGETIDQTLIREAKEETNLDVVNPLFLCFIEFINGKEFHDKRHMIFFNYRVDATSDDVRLNDEAEEFGWFTKDETMKLKLNKYVKETIEKYSSLIFQKSS